MFHGAKTVKVTTLDINEGSINAKTNYSIFFGFNFMQSMISKHYDIFIFGSYELNPEP